MKPKLTPVNKAIQHTYKCDRCNAVRTLRLRDWITRIHCSICGCQTTHKRIV